MKGSVKAKLIVFFIIAVFAFCISTTFANLTVTEDNDSYKLIPIENDSFEPNYINKVPTIIPKVENNTTQSDSVDWSDADNNLTDAFDDYVE